MAKSTSQHILNTSANLLGFCLFVITSLHVRSKAESTLIDEFTSIVAVVLTVSSIFSFLSIRSQNQVKEKKFEAIADYLFIAALVGILIIILLITLNFID